MKLIVRFPSTTKLGTVSLDDFDRPRITFSAILVDGIPTPKFEREGPAVHLLRGATEISVVKSFPSGRQPIITRPKRTAHDAPTIVTTSPVVNLAPAAPAPAVAPSHTPATVAPPIRPPPAPTSHPAPPSPAVKAAPLSAPAPPSRERPNPPPYPGPMVPSPKTARSTDSDKDFATLLVEQADSGLAATEALSGLPTNLEPEQLFRPGRIIAPDALKSLTGAYLKFAVTQPAPTDIPEAAREALVESTRRQHINYCKMIAREIHPDQPIDRALVSALQRLAAQRGWKQSTQMKAAAAIQGAFKILPLYFKNTASILLKDFPVWRMSLVTFGHRSKQELPDQPKAASWEQVSNAVTACKNDAQAMALLIGWLTAARLGCVRQLSKGDVKWSAQHTLVRFSKGKSARIRGPYTVHAQPIPREFRDRWKNYVESRQTALFPRHVTGNSLKDALRHIDPELEQRSIRRGALQAMALCDVDEETLMRYSGHTQVSTLRRYLNWNAMNSKVQKEMTEAGKPLVKKPTRPRK